MNNRLVLIITGAIALVVVPLVIWGVVSFTQQGTVPVIISTVPGDAKVKIGDKEFSGGNRTVRVKPGTYTITVSRDGFATDQRNAFIVDEQDGATLLSGLNPESDEAQAWYNKNRTAYLELEGKAGKLAIQEGQTMIEKYPITKWLPLEKAIYTVGYRQNSDNINDGIVVTVSAREGYREAALQELRDKGIDPSDYVIEFNDYRNPFNE